MTSSAPDPYDPHAELAPPRFLDYLRELIAADTLGGSKRFAKQTGLSAGYLCEIHKGNKLPAVERMERSLGESEIPLPAQRDLLLLLSRDKLLADPDGKPFFELLGAFVDDAQAKGVAIPPALHLLLDNAALSPKRSTRRLQRIKPPA